MRLTWLSNAPWSITGYGNQTRIFTPRLKALGHEVAVIAFYGLEGRMIFWNGIPVYPRGNHPYGQDVMSADSAHFGADVMISLMDAWVIQPQMLQPHATRWAAWFPVDSSPLPAAVKRSIEQAYERIVYSRFGERMVHEAGLDCLYVPHGVETDVFKPKPQRAAREATKFPQDAFIIGMVAANKGNPSRKCFQQQLDAFAEFHRRHPDTLLYLHTLRGRDSGPGDFNIAEYVDYLGLSDVVMFCDEYHYTQGNFVDEHLVNLYNSFDVLTNVSMGEGFGIPILEAQACGTPVIVGDWTAMGELCFGGWAIPKSEADPMWLPFAAHQFVPRVGAIVEAYETAYKDAGDHKLQKQARAGALPYDADTVTEEYWKPTLAHIEARIKASQQSFDELVGVAA